MEQIVQIFQFITDSFLHLWPYFLISIPLAVSVNLLGVSKIIKKTLNKKPILSIFFATILGALSPLCSCGVIPVISSLLIGGVPLAPVMSFWIASPSMDPEIFLLSTATIGWKLSIWRLISTFILSLASGYITHILVNKEVIGPHILRSNRTGSFSLFSRNSGRSLISHLREFFSGRNRSEKLGMQLVTFEKPEVNTNRNCCISVRDIQVEDIGNTKHNEVDSSCSMSCDSEITSFFARLLIEIRKATIMIAKFMGLAFLVNALINLYIPNDFIADLLGGDRPSGVFIASLVGVPVYTSNTTALPLIGGLLTMGMNQGAALAFLISGPTTTLPAMLAVWGIVTRKIFFLYISFALLGSFFTGILFNFIS